MNNRFSVPLRIAAVTAATTIAALSFGPAASAAGGEVDVVNTETVQVYTDASGNVQEKRVYEQVAMTGTGTVDLSNPIETDGLRNLDGFGGFDVEDGNQVTSVDVDGSQRLRTVSNYDGDLPLEVEVQYFLDDQRVEPGDVVGADGRLEVRYTVRNVTSAPQELTFSDGSGGEVTKTVEVPIPIVGSLTTIAPPSFTDVQSDQANIAGDGKGGTKLSFTMTLLAPLGSDTAEFGYTAAISDGVIPRADISALPVNPLANPTFKSAADSYQGGASTGESLAEGATEIDANLLKLRDGAGDLLAGLIQLRDGSSQLEAGLAGEAAPGARQLADGAGELDAGASKLDDGAGQLSAGAGQLDDGLGQLNSGARRLAAGTGEAFAGSKDLKAGAKKLDGGLSQLGGGVGDLDDGATQLADGQKALAAGLKTLYDGVDMLPESVRTTLSTDASYNALLDALKAIAVGVGSRTDAPTTPTLLGGLNKLQYGLDNPLATDANCDAGDAERCGVTNGLERIGARLFGALNGPASLDGTVAKLKATVESIKTNPDCTASCQVQTQAVADGLAAAQTASLTDLRNGVLAISGGIDSKILASGAGLDQLRAGLSNGNAANCLTAKATATTTDDCGIKEAATFLQVSGIPLLVDGITNSISDELKAGIGQPTKGCDPEATLRCAAAALADGGTQLTDGIDQLVAGVVQLSEGGQLLAAGAGDLSSGLGQIDDGAGQLAAGTGDAKAGTGKLADGAGQLADGTGQLKDGSGRLAAGAGDLADGLETAANGSTQLTDGLEQAADGAPQLVDGAQRLSDEGTKQLVKAGEDTAQKFGELFATIQAGSDRAQTESMAYGAPEGALGLTAYSFVIEGENGEGGRNLARGLTGLAILGAGAGAFAFRRGLI